MFLLQYAILTILHIKICKGCFGLTEADHGSDPSGKIMMNTYLIKLTLITYYHLNDNVFI